MRRIFESSLEKLARIISSQHGIRIVFKGQGASTDGKTINLPSTAELTPELMTDMQGFIDHEVAHCKFTDFPEFRKALVGRGGRFQKELLNAVEDSRIEIAMVDEFPGCRMNLDALNDKYRGRMDDQIRALGIAWPVRLICALRAGMDGREPILDPEIKDFFELTKDQIPAFKVATTTKGLREAAEIVTKRIIEKLDEEQEESGEGEPGKGEPGEGEGESGEKGDSEQENDDSGKGKGGGDKDDKGDSDDEAEGESEAGESGEAEGDDEGSSERPETEDAMMKPGSEDPSKEWDSQPTTVDELVKEALAEHFKKHPPSEEHRAIGGVSDPDRTHGVHLASTTEFDTEDDLTGTGNKERYRAMRADVRRYTSAIKGKLERLLKVKEHSRWRIEREAGTVNVRSLPGMIVNPNYRTPFREHVKDETNNVAITFLIDSSGSMSPKMKLTKMALIAMAEACKDLGVNFEIAGFSCQPDGSMRADREARGSGYNRSTERLEHKIFKRFDSDDLSGIEKLEAGGNNCDPESVRWAANRLSQQKQKRKILVVMNDGQPATGDGDMRLLRGALKDTVDKIMRAGMEVVGFGIMDGAVREFYRDNLVITEIDQLPTIAMQKLTQILTK